MITKIKTKELLKIINPITDLISFESEDFKIDFSELKKYVEKPRQLNVFKPSENKTIQLYKDLALYIINSSEPKIVNIDLDNNQPINSGVYEYIKNIYQQEEYTMINIPEDGNNSIFIKSKKLLNNPLLNIDEAKDVTFSKLSTVFFNSEKIVDNEKFFWKEENNDVYSNQNFVIKKFNDIIKSKNSLDEKYLSFISLIKITDQNLLDSDSFKIALIDINSEPLNNLLINKKHKIKNENFSIDFSSKEIHDKIISNIKRRKNNYSNHHI